MVNSYFSNNIITILGTHDIQNISVSSPLPGTVRVTGDFIQGSTATGLLVIVYSLSNDSNVYYNSYQRSNDQSIEATVVTDRLTSSQYGVSVFVLDDSVPFSRAATSPQLLYMSALTHLSMWLPVTGCNCGL